MDNCQIMRNKYYFCIYAVHFFAILNSHFNKVLYIFALVAYTFLIKIHVLTIRPMIYSYVVLKQDFYNKVRLVSGKKCVERNHVCTSCNFPRFVTNSLKKPCQIWPHMRSLGSPSHEIVPTAGTLFQLILKKKYNN